MFSIFLLIFNFYSEIIPPPSSWVNDYAKVLSEDAVFKLDSYLKNYQEKTGNQIFVLTINTIEPSATIEDFTMEVAQTWKAGAKGIDNGIIIAVAVNDRKTRIEVGYGLEDKVPDIIAGRIVKDYMLPYFKQGNYEAGIFEAVNQLVSYIGTQKLSESNVKKKQFGSGILFLIIFFIFFIGRLGFLPFLFLPFMGGSHRGGSSFGSGFGGGFGGGGGGGFGGGGSSGSW